MASKREERKQEVYFRVMRLIEENPSITTREIALKVGISNGAAYYCVSALIEKGLLKLKNFARAKKKANYFYELTPRGIKAKAIITLHFLERKRKEFNDLKLEIELIENELHLKKLEGEEKQINEEFNWNNL